jgi:uncharacterized protein YbaR (Trm112 family)
MYLSTELLAIIRCPVSGGILTYDPVRQVLISPDAGLEYPVIDGIPMLLASEAKKIKLQVAEPQDIFQ